LKRRSLAKGTPFKVQIRAQVETVALRNEQAKAQTSFNETGEMRLKLPARARRLFTSNLAGTPVGGFVGRVNIDVMLGLRLAHIQDLVFQGEKSYAC
jgi:hypothetical protein